MAYETGTATDSADLMNRLRTFLTSNSSLVTASQTWTELGYSENGNRADLHLRGQGLGGTDNIYINIRRDLFSADNYNWAIYGSTSYLSGVEPSQQPNASPNISIMLHNTPIQYWFFANGRRFCVVAKVNSVYQHLYAGFILPYATPTEYPYPLFIGGCSYSLNLRFSDTGNNNTTYYKGWRTGAIRDHSGQWRQIESAGQYSPTPNNGFEEPMAWPYCFDNAVSSRDPDYLVNCLGGTYLIEPIILLLPQNYPTPTAITAEIYGELDGVGFINGIDNASESINNDGSNDWLAFQNVYRTGRYDFAAYKRED